MRLLHRLRDPGSRFSIAHRMRSRRFEYFRALVDPLPRPIRMLDVGGTEDFWERMGFLEADEAEITILNLEAPPARSPHVRTLDGNACHMPMFEDDSFDVVFSNSVIEHVGGIEEQRAMANEIRRIGRRYFVQTPNRFFPIEPHFMFPFFQFLPRGLQVWLLMHLDLTFGGRLESVEAAEATAASVELLSERAFMDLFPGADLYREKVLGLTKSFIAHAGWNEPTA
ncbi:MAG TPA: class I SAM-dependent methyltransferase [Deltaproteobacteria bacterium]|nr:class I SAM-dependent methyltransferase [Deltaproteobacteria bacterium]